MLNSVGAIVNPSVDFSYSPENNDSIIISLVLCNFNRTGLSTYVDVILKDKNDNIVSYFITTEVLQGETQLYDTKLPLNLAQKLSVKTHSETISVTLGVANGGLL